MKILLLNQTFYPELLATSQQVSDLALFLRDRGHSVTAFTGRRGYEDRKKIFAKVEDWQGIRIERVHSTGFGKSSVFKRIVDSFTFDCGLLFKLLFSPRFDLVVSFTSPPLVGLFGALFCCLKGGRSVQWLMDVNPDAAFEVGYLQRDSATGRFLNAVFEWTLKKSSHIVVLDRWMKEKMVAHGAAAEKIEIVPPWSVLEKNAEASVVPFGAFRKENALEGKFVVLYSGNHSVVHPLDTVLQAALELKADKDIRFVFSGSGLRTQDVRAFKEKHGLTNIQQLPWQTREALTDSFGSADLHLIVMGQKMSGLVHTSKIYSVLSSGRPYLFVGPQKSHVVDVLTKCPGGKHVEQGDAKALVREILWFKNSPPERSREMGEKNQAFLAAEFGAELSKNKFEKGVVQKSILEPLTNPLKSEI